MTLVGGEFSFGASTINSLPVQSVPEIAIAGRSNCGKSTMINAIFSRKKLARVSSNPGCTRQINFYSVQNRKFMIVDLPGYGYSKASKEKILAYSSLINHYLLNRKVLVAILVLIDSKVGAKESDLKFLEWLFYHKIQFVIVLTKMDKIGPLSIPETLQTVKQQVAYVIGEHKVESISFHIVSAKSGFGINDLILDIRNLSGVSSI